MNPSVKCALITAFVSKTKDRFHEYNRDMTLAERLELVAQMEGMSGVEVIYPYEVKDAALRGAGIMNLEEGRLLDDDGARHETPLCVGSPLSGLRTLV